MSTMTTTTTTTTTRGDMSQRPTDESLFSPFPQRGTTLTLISTSAPRPTDDLRSESTGSAVPPPSPHRTFSGPPALSSPPSPSSSSTSQSFSPVTPRSPGYKKSLRFEKGEHELKAAATAPASSSTRRGEMAKRRHSADPKVNIHTRCGRHGDDWLFGGWKIWDRKDSKE